MLLQLINQVQFTQIELTEPTTVIPVSIILEKAPVATQFTATPPTQISTRKNVTPARPVIVTQTPPKPAAQPAISATSAMPESDPPAEQLVESSAVPALVTRVPPSASYLLNVIRTEPKLANPYYGAGTIRWNHDGQHYTMQMEVGLDMLFTTVRLYDMQSAGTIGSAGIKPHTTIETRRGKSTATTQFDYDNKTINFSADTTIIPLLEGAQDKITVLMQLASIGNADPSQFQVGKEITIQVAEEKEANLHQFMVLDQVTIESKLGHLATWHIVRPPRPGAYSSRIDIWLAPELNWLPVQIRNTEANGAITTQTIRQINED